MVLFQLVIQEFPKLKSLDISRCKNITPKGMELLHEGFPHLIALSACKMGSSTLSQSLAGLIRSHRDTLQRVEVSEIRWAPATLMTEIALLKNLTKLDISDTMLAGTTRFLDFLRKHCCCLQILRVAYCGFNTRAVSSNPVTSPIYFQMSTCFTYFVSKYLVLPVVFKDKTGLFHQKLRPKAIQLKNWYCTVILKVIFPIITIEFL